MPRARRDTELTQRQKEIIQLVRRGLTNREIADDLEITEDGVKAHLSRLFLRFGVTNRVELLGVVDADIVSDRTLAATAPLGSLRAIAGRMNAATTSLATSADGSIASKLAAVRITLAAVDGALGIVGDLPPETTGPVVAAVRKRLAEALAALDDARPEQSPASSA